jgi:hypothetical protein
MRGLKALVIGLGVILAIMFAIVVGELVRRLYLAKPAEPDKPAIAAPQPLPPPLPPSLGLQMQPAPLPGFGDMAIELPSGARVADFTASGDRLVLRLIMPDQEQRLMIVDLATGKAIGTLTLHGEAKARVPEIVVPPRNKSER